MPVPSDTKEWSHNIASLLLRFELILDILIGDKISCFLGEKHTAFLADDIPCRQNAIKVRFPASTLLYWWIDDDEHGRHHFKHFFIYNKKLKEQVS